MREEYVFTSESVTEGHPDKVCDYIADTILDACLEKDAGSHVACEVLCKDGHVTLAGEISPDLSLECDSLVRGAIREIGYTDPAESFCVDKVVIHEHISLQSAEINQGVDKSRSLSHDQGAGDQGIMFGYATNETATLMPLPILLAHALSRQLSIDRKSRSIPWLRPDGKTQVSVDYVDGQPVRVTDVVVSTQHAAEVSRDTITEYVRTSLLPVGLGEWFIPTIRLHVNPTGSFILGGPSADWAQDHRGHLRRLCPPRRRGLQRERSLQGRSQCRLLLPPCGARTGQGRIGGAGGNPGRLRHRRAPARLREG